MKKSCLQRGAEETLQFLAPLSFTETANVLTNTYRVTELYDLREEKPPADFGHLEEGNDGEK